MIGKSAEEIPQWDHHYSFMYTAVEGNKEVMEVIDNYKVLAIIIITRLGDQIM